MLGAMDGGADFKGEMHKYFWNRAMDAVDDQKRQTRTRTEVGEAEMKRLGITPRELRKRIEPDSPYSIDDVVDMYMTRQNEEKYNAVIDGNNISEERLSKICGHGQAQAQKLG